jgi:hypothetical protein
MLGRKHRKKKTALLSELAAEFGGTFKRNKITGSINESKFEAAFLEREGRTPPRMRIRLFSSFTESFTIRRENRFDRLAKKIKIVREIQVGYKKFDNNYFIEFGDKHFLKSFLKSKKKRDNIYSILKHPVKDICLKRKYCEINLSKTTVKNIEPETVKSLLKDLDELVKDIPTSSTSLKETPKPISTKALSTIIICLGFAIWIAGLVILVLALINYYPLDPIFTKALLYAIPISIGITAIILVLMFYVFRNRTDIHKILALALISILASSLFTGASFYLFSNGYLDDSPESEYRVTILDKELRTPRLQLVIAVITKSVPEKSKFILVNHWTDEKETYWLKVKTDFYDSAQKGNKILIRIRKGYRNIEWRAGYNFVE